MENPETSPAPASRRGRGAITGGALRSVFSCLGWRLVVILSGALVILLGATGWLALKLHRQQLYDLLEETAVDTGETILSSTYSSMLENDQPNLSQIIQSIGRRENVLALRLVDAVGTVRHSNHPDEVGTIHDIEMPVCQGCHAGDQVRSPESLRDGLSLYSLPTGEGALGLAVPVLNAPECSNAACHVHPPEQRVLGVLDLELSTAALEAGMRDATRQMTSFFIATIVVIATVIGYLTWRFAHRPLHHVVDGIRRLGHGNLSYRIPTNLPAEIGELATAFNEMSDRLEKAQVELEDWNVRLEAKVEEKTEELRRTRDQMVFTEKMASLGKLAAIVAHEINNPLAGILTYTKLVRRRLPKLFAERKAAAPAGDGYHQLDDKLSLIETETARCGDIVRNLLLFSRRRETSREPCRLNSTLERSLKLVRHQADLSGIRVQTQFASDLPQAICDAAEIEQAFVALLMNALEAMPDGGTLTLRTHFDAEHEQVVVDIADTGVGIEAELQPKIFEPFFSTKESGKGTGLGLAVTYGIVQRNRGRIDFDSTPGQGTTFHLRLPAHTGQTADQEGAVTTGPAAGNDPAEGETR